MQCPVSSCPDVQTSRAQMAQMASGLEAKKGSSPVFPANSAPNCLPAPHSSQHNTNLWVQRKFPSPRSGAAFHVFFFFFVFFSFFPVVERPCPTSSGQGQRAPIDFRARERLSYLSFFLDSRNALVHLGSLRRPSCIGSCRRAATKNLSKHLSR